MRYFLSICLKRSLKRGSPAHGERRKRHVLRLVEVPEVAHAVVALYPGLELLSQLDGDSGTAMALFGRPRRLAPVVDLLGT